jgi:lycopene beta-cyclase
MKKPIIILGGGLWGGLLAYRLQGQRPDIPFILVEKNSQLGGEHTWSFHGPDLSSDALLWIKPFLSASWDGYEVAFPSYHRRFSSTYHSIRSEKFHQVLQEKVPSERIRLSSELSLDTALKEAEFVIDARGLPAHAKAGYQKFLGLELELIKPHDMSLPLIKDASVEQKDGYRFIYYLPWMQNRILIEDTRYSTSPEFNQEELRSDLEKEILKRGWEVSKILRQETGCLPIPLTMLPKENRKGVIDLGGIYHDTTGYSLPFATRLIEKLIGLPVFTEDEVQKTVHEFRTKLERQRKFFRLLNRLMFEATQENQRYKMLEFFYRHRPALIERFYAGKLRLRDYASFFLGKPPVSIIRAWKVFSKEAS